MIRYDTTPFIRESIDEVFKTLLRRGHPGRARRAPVPAELAVGDHPADRRAGRRSSAPSPSWLAMGFSLNNLTLFGLVLAIGIVVDDAIVVVEAVEHHIEHGLTPRAATIKAMERGLRRR